MTEWVGSGKLKPVTTLWSDGKLFRLDAAIFDLKQALENGGMIDRELLERHIESLRFVAKGISAVDEFLVEAGLFMRKEQEEFLRKKEQEMK